MWISIRQSGRWDLNPRSPGPKPGGFPLSYAPEPPSNGGVRRAGIEPAPSAWEAEKLPLQHRRNIAAGRISKERASGGSRTRVAALRGRHPGHWKTDANTSTSHRTRPEGLEPSLSRLRAGRAAANTWTSARIPPGDRHGWSRTTVGRLSAACSPVELRAVALPAGHRPLHGAGGIRTPADRIKSPTCCRYTTTPLRPANGGANVL